MDEADFYQARVYLRGGYLQFPMHPPRAVLLLPAPPLGNNYCSGLKDVLESKIYGDPSLQADGAQTIFDLA